MPLVPQKWTQNTQSTINIYLRIFRHLRTNRLTECNLFYDIYNSGGFHNRIIMNMSNDIDIIAWYCILTKGLLVYCNAGPLAFVTKRFFIVTKFNTIIVSQNVYWPINFKFGTVLCLNVSLLLISLNIQQINQLFSIVFLDCYLVFRLLT